MEELLVVFACLNSSGCSETSNVYYQTHPEVREMIQDKERSIKKYAGPVMIETVGPMIVVFSGGTGNLRLNHLLSLQFTKTNNKLIFNLEF